MDFFLLSSGFCWRRQNIGSSESSILNRASSPITRHSIKHIFDKNCDPFQWWAHELILLPVFSQHLCFFWGGGVSRKKISTQSCCNWIFSCCCCTNQQIEINVSTLSAISTFMTFDHSVASFYFSCALFMLQNSPISVDSLSAGARMAKTSLFFQFDRCFCWRTLRFGIILDYCSNENIALARNIINWAG